MAANGPAGVVSLGNAQGAVLAGEDIFTSTVGWQSLDLVGGEDVVAFAGGKLMGYISAGNDAFAAGFDTLDALLFAGRDAAAVAAGDVNGFFQAGADLALASYGDLNAMGVVGEDLLSLWSGGKLEGTYLLGNEVFEVFSHGTMFVAMFGAAGPIHSVEAVGSIGGLLESATSIDLVRSGDEITAILVAPSVGAVEENVTSLATLSPPDAPTFDPSELLALADLAYVQLVAEKAAIIAENEVLKAELDAFREELSEQLDQEVADAVTRWMEAHLDAAEQLTELVESTEQYFDALRAAFEQDDLAMQIAAEHARAEALLGRLAAIDEAIARFEAAKAKTRQAIAEAEQEYEKMQAGYLDAQAADNDEVEAGTHWATPGQVAWRETKRIASSFFSLEAWHDSITGAFTEAADRWKLVDSNGTATGASRGEILFQQIAIFVYDRLGVTDLWKWQTGEDPLTLQKYSNTERLFAGVSGGLTLIGWAAGARRPWPCFAPLRLICHWPDF